MTTALVTGGSRGIGRALAIELARGGAEVIVTGRDRATLDAAIRAIPRARALVLDAGDTDATVSAIRAIDAEVGGLDLVVANAGVGMPDPTMTPYAWEAIAGAFHVNFCGAAATLTAALPAMVTRGRGHLVGISSLASMGPLPEASAYCAPKAGLAMLLRCLRLDLAGTGVAVTRVDLGFVRTAMVARSTHPMPQLLEPEEAARQIVGALVRRPAVITLPRGLARLTRLAASAPDGVKAELVRLGRRLNGRRGSP